MLIYRLGPRIVRKRQVAYSLTRSTSVCEEKTERGAGFGINI